MYKSAEMYRAEARREGKCLVHPGNRKVVRRYYQKRNSVDLPSDIFVCHHCDHPRCIRDEHLFLGTCGDNARDAAAKGRLHQCFKKGSMIGHKFKKGYKRWFYTPGKLGWRKSDERETSELL